MNKLLVLSGVLLLGACAPGQFMDRHNGTVPEMSGENFEYIGCHMVTGEEYVMGLPGFDVRTTGNRIWFKQRNEDGSSARTELKAKPCGEFMDK
jgi:hypothetical protein|tara:strand:+ start:586 stop:867 length:282 start_codon:yes stop_codon:yes gene_type:complete